MLLFLTESDVAQYLTMEAAIDVVEAAFREIGEGQAQNFPRTRLPVGDNRLHFMAAALPRQGFMGIKIYTSFKGRPTTNMLLYSAQTGRMLAMFESWTLSAIRTGAATAVATKYMAREDAQRVGVYGSSSQAVTQLEAVAAVRPITHCTVYSLTPDHRERFAGMMSERLGIEVTPAGDPEQAARGQDIIITATNAHEPIVRGEWLEPGVHLNVIGSNYAQNREVDDEAVVRSSIVAADSVEQSQRESGDLIYPIEAGRFSWDQVLELGDVVAGKEAGRRSEADITLFKSNGINVEDVAVAGYIYTRYRKESPHMAPIPSPMG